jgi:hypothetical protein
MSKTTCRLATLAALAALATPAAYAQAIFQTGGLMSAAAATDTATALTFTNSTAATQAVLTFDLYGTLSLDGNNDYIDVFKLTANGTSVLTGTFNMSGGGASDVFENPFGAVVTTTTYTPADHPACTQYNYCGGVTHVSVTLNNLQANGANELVFAYTSPTSFNGTARNGWQGIGDEGWYVGAVNVAAVPEPETYAMMLAGLGLLGGMVRRRQRRIS